MEEGGSEDGEGGVCLRGVFSEVDFERRIYMYVVIKEVFLVGIS